MMLSKIMWPVAGALAVVGVVEVGEVVLPPPIEGVGRYDAPVKPGELVLVDWQIVKRTECPGETSRAWSGERRFRLTEPQQETALPAGNLNPMIQTRIPELAPPGRLELRIVGYFRCEGYSRQDFDLGPVVFEVI